MADDRKELAFACRLFACRGRKTSLPFREELQVYLKNDSSVKLESVVLEKIGFEWGDVGTYTEEEKDFGSVAPGSHILIWRDDDASPELRMDAWLRVRWESGEQRLLFEFSRLYMDRDGIPVIPELGCPGFIATPQVLSR
jgi:hypothetical protein